MTTLTMMFSVAAVMYIATIMISLIRLTIGPTVTDRAVASDVIAVAVIALCALIGAASRRDDLQTITVVFTLIGFLYAVMIGRFTAQRAASKKILTPAQAAQVDLERLRQAERELHDEERKALKDAYDARPNETQPEGTTNQTQTGQPTPERKLR